MAISRGDNRRAWHTVSKTHTIVTMRAQCRIILEDAERRIVKAPDSNRNAGTSLQLTIFWKKKYPSNGNWCKVS